MKKLLSIILALLLALFVAFSAVSCSFGIWDGEKSDSVSEEGNEPELSLSDALSLAASELKENGINDANGTPIDVASFCDLFQSKNAYSIYKLSLIELIYETYYIGVFRSVSDLASDMLAVIARSVDLTTVMAGDKLTNLLVEAYITLIGDRYAAYFPPEEYTEYQEDLSASYTGIGVQVLLQSDGYIEILQVYPGTPALEAGLVEGDILVAVEGEDVAEIGYNPTIARVRGEEGTEVTITVLRGEQRLSFTIKRARLTEYSVDYRMLTGDDDTTGYIRISEFDDGTFPQFVAAYRALKQAGADRFVFDVRANPGGELEAIVAVLEYILPDGPIAYMNYAVPSLDRKLSSVFDVVPSYHTKYSSYRGYYDDIEEIEGKGDHVITEPFAVLVNGYTASAGELFSSAIRDYAHEDKISAALFGVNTYGKGCGQTTFDLDDGSYLNVSIFYYDPPCGVNYDGVGIVPDYVVELSPEAATKSVLKLTEDEDTQLAAALAYLRVAE